MKLSSSSRRTSSSSSTSSSSPPCSYSIGLWTSLLLFFTLLLPLAIAETAYDAIRSNDKLSRFAQYVEKGPILSLILQNYQITVFAPTDDAFKNAVVNQDDKQLASYHTVGILASKDLFPTKVNTYVAVAAPLYLTKKEQSDSDSNSVSGDNEKLEYYVNNAKIIEEHHYESIEGGDQILYIIDEVLEPYISKSPQAPSAFELLSSPDLYTLAGTDTSNVNIFASKVKEDNLENLFNKAGNHTYFIPLEIGANRLRDVDSDVIRGHVIPNHVLFLKAMGSKIYNSDAFDDNIKVHVSKIDRPISDTISNYYIQSNVIQKTGRLHGGISMSRVVRANIPVQNGVVHFIQKPLMIIDISVWDFLGIEISGRLTEFVKLVEKLPSVKSEIMNANEEKTILAPTNQAFEGLAEKIHTYSPEKLSQILKLHVIKGSIPSEMARSKVKEAVCMDELQKIYFEVNEDQGNRILTVEGGGVNATAIQPDIGATNGIIHIIDKVLGVPYQTIMEKLRDDASLVTTYNVGAMGANNWNERLGTERQFTLFAPADQAWKNMSIRMPSEYKQLTEGIYPRNAEQILDRHLLVGEGLSVQDLLEKEEISTIRGKIKIKRSKINPGDTIVEWEGIEAKILRPDVQAVNGVIHVIDLVLMKKRDLAISPGLAINGSPRSLVVTVETLFLTLTTSIAAILFFK